MKTLKYDPHYLQKEAEKLGSWKKVCEAYKISQDTIHRYKKAGLIHAVSKTASFDITAAQALYDDGLSIRKLAAALNAPINQIQKHIQTRSVSAGNLLPRQLTDAGRRKLSDSAKLNKLGGYRPHPNKGLRYKDIWFDSRWEVLVAKSLDENNILWERPSVGFVWTDCGRKYFPDFFLPEYNLYLDPKNPYLQIKDALKIFEAQRRNNIKVLVLGEQQLNWNSIAEML